MGILRVVIIMVMAQFSGVKTQSLSKHLRKYMHEKATVTVSLSVNQSLR